MQPALSQLSDEENITRIAHYDHLQEALEKVGLNIEDEADLA